MSLTLVYCYIIIGISCLLFINYKFLKLFFSAKSRAKPSATTAADGSNGTINVITKKPSGIWSIPGPLILPIIGTKWIYLWRYKMSKIHEVYREFNRKYGPIVLEVVPGGIPVVNLYNRLDIEKVLRFPSKYPFRPPTEIVAYYRRTRPDRYASTGITNEQGETWHHLRTKLTAQITSHRVLNAFLPTLNTICDDFIELLKDKRDPMTNSVNDFQDIVNLLGLEAVCTLMLGRRMGFLSTNPPDNVRTLAAAVKMLFITQRDTAYGFGLWKYIPTSTYRDFVATEDTIYTIISDIVDGALSEEQHEFNDDDVGSVFRSILCDKDLDVRDKKSAIIDFIAAGIETLAHTLIFVLNYVTADDGVNESPQKKCFKEFEHCGDVIDSTDLSIAVYTKACLQETYRICPTAFCLARILEQDTVLSGYQLKAGTVVLCQTMTSCHDSINFKEADKYIPERWLEDDAKVSSRCTEPGVNLVVPFGVGKRQCPGRRFVEMELILILAKLVRTFEISFCDKLEMEFEFLLAPKTPVNLVLKERLF